MNWENFRGRNELLKFKIRKGFKEHYLLAYEVPYFNKNKTIGINTNLQLFRRKKSFYKTKNELDRLCSKDQISHQGLIAEIEHLEEISLKDYLNLSKKNSMLFVALEEVTDPRNIGAIIRSAASFNVDGLIIK